MRSALRGLFLSAVTTFVGSLTQAQTLTTLHFFDGTDGFPNTSGPSLIQGPNGDLYGTTSYGGSHGGGTVFRITASGKFKSLYNFCSQASCTDGSIPVAGLVLASNGDFYGTTEYGGAYGQGSVFKITPAGALTTLYSFCAVSSTGPGELPCLDGRTPKNALIQAADGNLYGTTNGGGLGLGRCTAAPSNCDGGTVFRISPAGALSTLYSFCSQTTCADGSDPAGLVQGNDGNFYGTTESGGLNSPYTNISPGTIFKITPGGELTTLYDFCSTGGSNGAGFCADGQNPYEIGSLLSDGQGNFYGTTFFGGSGSAGIVFEITSAGAYSVLVSNTGCVTFCSPGASAIAGAFPSPVIQGSDGNLYGTTYEEGAFNYGGGSIFEIASGVASTLYTFPCAVVEPCDTVGAYPSGVLPSYGALLQATDGNLYGLAQNGGTYNATCPSGCGTVFKFSTGLSPFVKTRTSSGIVGAAVTILGTDLTGATGVTFNGTAASFVVKTATEITATVPTGATTGAVQVVTPNVTLSSNVPYTVISKPATPTFKPAAGTYAAAQTVTINDATAGSTIYYTTDGTTPSLSSTPYTGPVAVAASATLKAIALGPDDVLSGVKTGTYTIN
jgi:uncharacterized repeat protein (TIGR03803 family)